MPRIRLPHVEGRSRHLLLPALTLAFVALLQITGATGTGPAPERWTPLTPAKVAFAKPGNAPQARGTVLSFNDFHGNLEPPSFGFVTGVPAGGAEYLATTVKALRAEAADAGRQVHTAGAGDMIGGTPLISAAFHDEPSIEVLNLLGMDVSSVGNHEFDEGVAELQRIQNGGCHPTDGCADGDPYGGAEFNYLAANVVDKQTRQPVLPAYQVRRVNGVKVGFIGMTLEATPTIVNPAGIASVDFLDEVQTANGYADRLRREQGVQAFVLLIHEGGRQQSPAAVSGCNNIQGAINGIVAGLRPEFGLVISGHTHQFYTCDLPNSGGRSVVTSAGSAGVLVTDIDVDLDRRSGRFSAITARNVIVENGVRNPDGTYQRTPSGGYVRNPALVDPEMKALVDKYRAAVAPIANREVGNITADITRQTSQAGEMPLGDVIADAQLAYARSVGGQIALMNPGGVRADLVYARSGAETTDGVVTYGEAFTVQPFNNLVVTQTFTGAQLKAVLEQQFGGCSGQDRTRILQPSAGFTYTYDTRLACGQRCRTSRSTARRSPMTRCCGSPRTTSSPTAGTGSAP